MLAGFTSQCSTPCLCRYAMPRATSVAMTSRDASHELYSANQVE